MGLPRLRCPAHHVPRLCWWLCAGGAGSKPCACPLSQHPDKVANHVPLEAFVHRPRTGVRGCACGSFPAACTTSLLQGRPGTQAVQPGRAGAGGNCLIGLGHVSGQESHVEGAVVMSAGGGTAAHRHHKQFSKCSSALGAAMGALAPFPAALSSTASAPVAGQPLLPPSLCAESAVWFTTAVVPRPP